MKKLFILCACLFITGTLFSCSNVRNTVEPKTITENNIISSSDNDIDTNESLLLRINNLEKEINSLKEELKNTTLSTNNHDILLNAFDNINGDNILLSIDSEKDYLNAVHVKVPKGDNLSYKFYLLAGTEVDGVPILDSLIKPQIDTSDNPEKIDIDQNKYQLYKLMTSKLKYDENSAFLIIITDNIGNEYTQFIHSAQFMGDK